MLAFIDITLNLFVFTGIIAVSMFIGFLLKNIKLNGLRKVVEKLEKEMLNNHAEILQLQKELSNKNTNTNQSQAPIVSIRDITAETAKENLPDSTSRKKMSLGTGKPAL